MKIQQYFVTGIDTDIGKTISAAILVEALQADYWKPVQAGALDYSDTMAVQGLISNSKSHFFEESYRLNTPASPHYAAEIDGIELDFDRFELPKTNNNLIVEGAGGLFVPLNSQYLIIDLIQKLNLPVILISKSYLGSINHTLLSIDALQKRNIPIAGIIFNGETDISSKDFILNYTKINYLGNFPWLKDVSKKDIAKQAVIIKESLAQITSK